MVRTHLLLYAPDEWSNDKKGQFFERFVSDILVPMRYEVVERVRFTGMEVDLLAKAMDRPHRVLVECKAQKEPLSSDVISKLLGNVDLNGADSGWLFATSELSKDGKGQWDRIQNNPSLAPKMVWYSPSRIIDIMCSQKAIVSPLELKGSLGGVDAGDATLVVLPAGLYWLIEILVEGLPALFCVSNAVDGAMLPEDEATEIGRLSPRFASLRFYAAPTPTVMTPSPQPIPRAPVARVVPGDTWPDLRPARPIDFVGRDDVIREITTFLDNVRLGKSRTRTFAVQGPSGWGKSSLILKLTDLAARGRITNCSITAVDTRSATNSAFVAEALKTAFRDAEGAGLIANVPSLRIESLAHPLDSDSFQAAMDELKRYDRLMVLVFDQFEELFTKEQLFETFNAVKELSLEIDAREIPLVLGFAWKTDITLPQLHPAYHLWHELADRRKSFAIREFGPSDIRKVLSKADRAFNTKLLPSIKARLVDQCQGFPWLLKKLAVHILTRLSSVESQYALLDRELDVEILFKDDLSPLTDEQIQCLKYVASHQPVPVPEVESSFSRETTSVLTSRRLLVRSGMNYVVYWDIFRDYLTEGRVPNIPWGRTFQREPRAVMRAIQKLLEHGPMSTPDLAKTLGMKERACSNVISDMIALQLVERTTDERYGLNTRLKDFSVLAVAEHAQKLFLRHVVFRETLAWERGAFVTADEWQQLIQNVQPGSAEWSPATLRQYAASLRSWLAFVGLLETSGARVSRPRGIGRQMGVIHPSRVKSALFLGTSTPEASLRLLELLQANPLGVPRSDLVADGFRNAVSDCVALGLVARSEDGRVYATERFPSPNAMGDLLAETILEQQVVRMTRSYIERGVDSDLTIGLGLKDYLRTNWKDDSARRYAGGLRRFLVWATDRANRDGKHAGDPFMSAS